MAAKRARAAAHKRGHGLPELNYKRIFQAGPIERIEMVKAGLPAAQAKRIIADLRMSTNMAGSLAHVPISTLNRKVKNEEILTPDVSERFLGLAKLIGQVQTMVEESGASEGFDAKTWTARWLNEPLPAFGGIAPVELMDTMEGQALVSATLARMQSGAYA
jgi:putative toxin-antitoxin system antitoxin component (TIGR02293 family)